jgi:hypothetical protein
MFDEYAKKQTLCGFTGNITGMSDGGRRKKRWLKTIREF